MNMQPAKSQQGMMLVEVLVAIVLFSIGIVGMINMQSATIKDVSQAGYRAEASYLASQIIAMMWADRGNLGSYALNANGQPCTSGANASANQALASWLQNDLPRLPNSSGLKQQIVIGANNLVTVTVCWKAPSDASPHQFFVTTQIN